MSVATKCVCDGCTKELERYREPYQIEIRHRPTELKPEVTTTHHACSADCYATVMNRICPAPPPDQTVSKGVYR